MLCRAVLCLQYYVVCVMLCCAAVSAVLCCAVFGCDV